MSRKLSSEDINQFFDEMKEKLGRVPTSTEFGKKHVGALGAIYKRRYNKNICTWNKYLIHRGEKPNPSKRRWVGVDLVKYYLDNYGGFDRGELQRKDGSFYNLLCKFGKIKIVPAKRKTREYWENETNLLNEIDGLMEEHGLDTLPNYSKMSELGHSDLANAINRYHGGLNRIRENLGEHLKVRAPNTWKSLDYTLQQARTIMEQHKFGTLPSDILLRRLGYQSLANAIVRHHGGFHKFRFILGQAQIIEEKGIWKDLDYTLKKSRIIMKENKLDRLPGNSKLAEMGYSSLGAAVSKYHGGFHKFRILLGEIPRTTLHGEINILEDLLEDGE